MAKSSWVVLKFGGTSVAGADCWKHILNLVRERLEQGLRPLIVCSALAGVSDLLTEAYDLAVDGQEYLPVYRTIIRRHRALCEALRLPLPAEAESLIWQLRRQLVSCAQEQIPSAACKAKVLAFGELLASVIGHAWLRTQGLALTWLDARGLLCSHDQTDSPRHYLSAECDASPDPALAAHLSRVAWGGVITQGYIASDAHGETVLLGRGGSDTSATCLAARLEAERVEIWTDVPGIFTARPQAVPQARLLPQLDYEQAERMACLGAKILQPRSLAPLRPAHIPLQIRSLSQQEVCTQIGTSGRTGRGITAVLARSGLVHFAVKAAESLTAEGLRALFSRHALQIASLSCDGQQASILIDPEHEVAQTSQLKAVLAELESFARVEFQINVTSLSLLGEQPVRALSQRFCAGIEQLDVHMADDSELTLLLPVQQQSRLQELMQQLHSELIESAPSAAPSWAELSQEPSLALAS